MSRVEKEPLPLSRDEIFNLVRRARNQLLMPSNPGKCDELLQTILVSPDLPVTGRELQDAAERHLGDRDIRRECLELACQVYRGTGHVGAAVGYEPNVVLDLAGQFEEWLTHAHRTESGPGEDQDGD